MGLDGDSLLFYLNGSPVEIPEPDPRVRLIDYLRSPEVGLTGTKLACGEGGCGACTVALSSYDEGSATVRTRAVNACLRPLCAVDRMAVTTTEGLGSLGDGLDPVQAAIASMNGSQCGFCTPGFVMSLHALLESVPQPSAQRIEDSFDGHICRCTGYRPILRAARTFAHDPPPEPAAGTTLDCLATAPPTRARRSHAMPEALATASPRNGTSYERGEVRWLRPASLTEAQACAQRFRAQGALVRLVVGNTTSGLPSASAPDVYIDVERLPELCGVELDAGILRIGASTTLGQLVEFLTAPPDPLTPRLSELGSALQRIASVQVRNAGSLAGNIVLTCDSAATDSPFPSDAYTALLAMDATVEVASGDFDGGRRTFALAELPATDALPPDAIVRSFSVLAGGADEVVAAFKVAGRRQDAHAIVGACFCVELTHDGRVRDVRLAVSGIAPLPFRAEQAEAVLRDAAWDEASLARALGALAAEVEKRVVPFPTSAFLPAGYRESLPLTLLYKFFVRVAEGLDLDRVAPRNRSAGSPDARPLSHGEQYAISYPEEAPVGEPIINRNAFAQATGEAEYTQDKPLQLPGRHAAAVLSRRARSSFSYPETIEDMEAELRRMYPSVDCIVSAADIAEDKNLQGLGGDEPVLADGEVLYDGQLIALVVGRDLAEASAAADWLGDRIRYVQTPGAEPILTIDEALAQPGDSGLLTDNEHTSHIAELVREGSDEAWLEDPERHPPGWRLVRGCVRTPGQAHFYMETQTCVAVPVEHNRFVLYSSTQNLNNDQCQSAAVLDIPAAGVQVSVRRIGGGFGGKQLRSAFVSIVAALAARKVGHPVRFALTRQQDMRMVGTRHPYRIDYALAFTDEGALTAAKFDLVSDGGCSRDCSFPVMDLSQQHADVAYFVETFGTAGRIARTNRASNTAFRSFGIVQATLATETAIEHAAHELGLLPERIREVNLYRDSGERDGQRTHFGQLLEGCAIRSTWSELARTAEFEARLAEVCAFNERNRWRKRGISMAPLKYGVGYQPRMLDQGNAFVTVYAEDGSVLVQHGGVEMGQGINTKLLQIAARALGIPMEGIRVGDTWTGSVPNASATAASTGTDLNGAAVRMACEKLRRRLERFAEDTGREGWWECWAERWPELVSAAYAARIDLGAHALFRTPHLGNIDKDHPYGHAFAYFVYAVACSEVEIDVLTGETTVRRADILYDAGKSINPCLDVGQVEGAYVQGLGMMLTERQLVAEDGSVLSDGTWEYKPPCSKTIPVDFRVALVSVPPGAPARGPTGVNSSKGVGEPAFVLAVSALSAVRHAIASARADRGEHGWFELEAPATPGVVQSKCLIDPAELVLGEGRPHRT
jgi:xanthine dehydrogenase/oxidase